MKFDTIKNPNYVATIIRVAALEDLEGLDNLKGLRIFGMQALVSKDVQVGDIGVLFSTEVQLSEAFAKANNLHRHSDRNADQTKTGYLDDNRRVKAIKLRGHRSDSLFMSLDAFSYLGIKPSEFNVGDTFDSIGGKEILRKYLIREPRENKGTQAKVRRVDLKVFPMHIDSENYWRNAHKIPQDAPVVVTQKLHGTSVRYGNVPVLRTKGFIERLVNKLGFPTLETEHKFVVGSRTVVKSIDLSAEEGKEHYYGDGDIWTKYADDHNLKDVIPAGYLVFGELVGWTPSGQPIQPNYTYDVPQPIKIAEGITSKYAALYVYRVATVTESGVVTDLSWPAAKAFAHGAGLKTVPEFRTAIHTDITVDDYLDKRFYDWQTEDWAIDVTVYGEQQTGDVMVPLSGGKELVDEGVCVRYDGPNGIYILKAKSPIFLGHESKMLDESAADVESEEAA